jgi:hydroxymethylpyrimidine pyrophosphatase-like HAD family hydrolase
VRYRDLAAVCIDGALLGQTAQVTFDDVRAVELLRRRGIAVVLVTSRMPRASAPIARALGADVAFVAGDGTIVCDAATGRVLAREPLAQRALDPIVAALSEAGLARATVTDRSVHVEGQHADLAWRALGSHAAAELDHDASPPPRRDVLFVLGLGTHDAVMQAADACTSGTSPSAEAIAYEVEPGVWALRVQRRQRNRARAIAAIAARLGIDRRRTAYLGGDAGAPYSDHSPYGWAGTAFCVADALGRRLPPSIRPRALACAAGAGALREIARLWP